MNDKFTLVRNKELLVVTWFIRRFILSISWFISIKILLNTYFLHIIIFSITWWYFFILIFGPLIRSYFTVTTVQTETLCTIEVKVSC